jgi:hypothetical protein
VVDNALVLLRTAHIGALDGSHTVTSVLGWLWDQIAGPILDHFDRTNPAEPDDPDDRQRLWWVPTGPLALLPLHAAGHHGDRAGRSVLVRVVSSYTPTIRSLWHTRGQLTRSPPPGPGGRR